MPNLPSEHTANNPAELAEICHQLGSTEARLDNLEVWQKAQNGHLERIDQRLERFVWFLVGILATSSGTLLLVVLGQAGVLGPR